MLSIARKKVIEVTQNKMFLLITIFFSLLFPGILAIIYNAQSSDVNSFPIVLDPKASLVSGPYRVAVVGDSVPAFLSLSGDVRVDLFASRKQLDQANIDLAVKGYPFPFLFGVDMSEEPVILLRNTSFGNASYPLDVPSYLQALLLSSGTKKSFLFETYVSDFNSANFAFPFYGPLVYTIGLVFLIPSFMQLHVKDQRTKAFFVTLGLSKLQYFLGTYVVDAVLFFVLGLLGLVITVAARLPFADHAALLFAGILLLSLSAPLLALVASKAFTSEETAQKWGFAFFSLAYIVLSLPNLILSSLQMSESVQRWASLVPAFVYPPSAFSRLLTLLASESQDDVVIVLPALAFGVVAWSGLLTLLERSPARLLAPEDDNFPITVENLRVTYRTKGVCCCVKATSKDALKGVSVRVERGQVFSLLGPNGSGKSSLIKTLLQNAVPHTVDRLSVLGQSDPALVSLVEQEDIKMEFLSVEQVLRLVSECRGEPSTAEAERLMRALDLNKCRGQKLSLLSGGQRRKVSLAASLIGSRVRLMILDEPTAGIDIVSRRAVHALLRERVAQGCTVFFTSHSMDEVIQLANSAGILVDGKIEAQGTISELLEEYARGYLIRIMRGEEEGVPIVDRIRGALPPKVVVVEELNVGNGLHLRVEQEKEDEEREQVSISSLLGVMNRIKENTSTIKKFAISNCSLQTAFVKFVEMQNRLLN